MKTVVLRGALPGVAVLRNAVPGVTALRRSLPGVAQLRPTAPTVARLGIRRPIAAIVQAQAASAPTADDLLTEAGAVILTESGDDITLET